MREEARSPVPWPALAALAGVKIALTMAVADRYGWHRDELYYLASSKHLALGYVDYPPVTPLLAAADQLIFPRSLAGLRLLTVLAGAAIIVIAALIARELGGNRLTQALAGLAALISPMFVGANILFQTVSFDQLIWAVAILIFVRLLLGAGQHEWLLLGTVIGIGLETKYTIIGLGIGMLIALLATRQRRMLRSPWPWAGLALALVLMLPNLAWQTTHDWDSVAYTLNHRGATDGPVFYWVQQLLLVGPQLLPIVIMGGVWLWRNDRVRTAAVLVIAVELVFFLAGGKAYYPAPIYPLLYAAGSIWFMHVVPRVWSQRLSIAAALLVTLLLLPIGLPVLPARTMVDLGIWEARKDYADMIGWPELTQQVTGVYLGLSPGERSSTMILTNNYGEAGAVQFYGQRLPAVVCPELTFYYWAPPRMTPSTIIVVGYERSDLTPLLGDDITQAGTVTNALGIDNEEWGKPIWIVRNPPRSLSQVWPQLKSLD